MWNPYKDTNIFRHNHNLRVVTNECVGMLKELQNKGIKIKFKKLNDTCLKVNGVTYAGKHMFTLRQMIIRQDLALIC